MYNPNHLGYADIAMKAFGWLATSQGALYNSTQLNSTHRFRQSRPSWSNMGWFLSNPFDAWQIWVVTTSPTESPHCLMVQDSFSDKQRLRSLVCQSIFLLCRLFDRWSSHFVLKPHHSISSCCLSLQLLPITCPRLPHYLQYKPTDADIADLERRPIAKNSSSGQSDGPGDYHSQAILLRVILATQEVATTDHQATKTSKTNIASSKATEITASSNKYDSRTLKLLFSRVCSSSFWMEGDNSCRQWTRLFLRIRQHLQSTGYPPGVQW